MRPKEAADLLGVNVNTVYYWIHKPEMAEFVTTTTKGLRKRVFELSPGFIDALKSEVSS